MIILEEPYVSGELCDWLEASRTPVLRSETAAALRRGFALCDPVEFAARAGAGERIYTTSENALGWVLGHITAENVLSGIRCMKDKFLFRETLRPLFPGFPFAGFSWEELSAMPAPPLPPPFILKPAVGFFSAGVHVIAGPGDWPRALAALAADRERWRTDYPAGVVGGDRFVLEGYIPGEEYAVDAYFDGEGRPVILNVMKHDFTSADDVSDRLYYTGARILRDTLPRFGEFFSRMNAVLGLRDFPFHAELREDGGQILPIECNPLRFAGWCTTDLTLFAFGFRTYEYYLQNRAPDWEALLTGKENDLFSLGIIEKARPGSSGADFNYGAVCRMFTEILSLRRFDSPASPVYGFLFARTPAERQAEEMERFMRADLTQFQHA